VSLDGEAYTTAWERLPVRREYGWWAGYRVHLEKARVS